MQLTRRYFLQASGALAAYVGVGVPQLLAQGITQQGIVTYKNKSLVVIFLRGGADGLNLVVPFADEHYYKLRRSIAIPSPAHEETPSLDLDGKFALHPRLAPLMPLFDEGLAIAAHAVGYAHNTRSHFEEQDTWETGVIGNTVNSDGWLNRHLATSEGHGPIRAVSIGNSLPRILHGKAPAFAIRGVNDLTMPARSSQDRDAVAAALEHAYCTPLPTDRDNATDLLSQTAATTLDGMSQLRSLASSEYKPAAEYPNTPLANKLKEVARLIKANVGLEVAEVTLGGWDTHASQGGTSGAFANLTGQLATAIAAFTKDLQNHINDTCIVTMTDFGRTAAENGSSGTDHGWGNVMFLAGGPVLAANQQEGNPRKVITAWPGLAPDQLNQGRDLKHTTDFRDVIAELVRVHLGNPNIEHVLPSHSFKPLGLIA